MSITIAAHIIGKDIAQNYLYKSLLLIAKKHPDVNFLIVIEESILCKSKNVRLANILYKNKLLLGFWHRFHLRTLLRELGANCFITNYKLCNAKINIPQYFFINEDVSTIKKSILANIQKANAIFVTEDFIAEQFENKIDNEKIKIVHHGLMEQAKSLNYNQKKSVQGEYANGYDYYLFYVDTTSAKYCMLVLKAFSILKKWQKTSIKLLLLLDNVAEENLISDFNNYKYKSDVVFVNKNNESCNALITSSFAFIYLSDYKNINNLFFALQTKVPAIVNNTEINNSIFKKAVLYTHTNEVGIAANMQQLYKDEQLKNELQLEAVTILKKYDSNKTATVIYETIKNNS